MYRLEITGGVPLRGTVRAAGAKNAALPAITATVLAPGRHELQNVPGVADVNTMGRLITNLGGKTTRKASRLFVDTTHLRRFEATYDLVKTMRASILVLGPMLARYGRATVSLPGGCAIGARPINLHLKALEAMGAHIALEHGNVVASCPRLQGARIVFDGVTVTGTENIMMAAALARGGTVLENAAREPEVADLARMLNAMGARIQGAGTGIIEIEGVDELRPVRHEIIPDRIEAGTFMVAAAITGGDVVVENARAADLEAVIAKLREAGAEVTAEAAGLRVLRSGGLAACDVQTHPHPGFPTDMQAQFMALMTVAAGTSVIQENVFENRFMHVQELSRMGAAIEVQERTAIVRGPARLAGARVMATDLRASACLAVAALAAEGKTTIYRIYHLDRGYERLERKLRKLGARIRRVKSRGFD